MQYKGKNIVDVPSAGTKYVPIIVHTVSEQKDMAITDIEVIGNTIYCKLGEDTYLLKVLQKLKANFSFEENHITIPLNKQLHPKLNSNLEEEDLYELEFIDIQVKSNNANMDAYGYISIDFMSGAYVVLDSGFIEGDCKLTFDFPGTDNVEPESFNIEITAYKPEISINNGLYMMKWIITSDNGYANDSRSCKSIPFKIVGTENLTTMSGMFEDFGSSSEADSIIIDITDFNTANVEDMSCLFIGCGATEINMSNLDTSKVKYVQRMFYRNKRLKKINISNLDFSSVQPSNTWGFFGYCPNLEEIVGALDCTNFGTGFFQNLLSETKVKKITLKNVAEEIKPEITNSYLGMAEDGVVEFV